VSEPISARDRLHIKRCQGKCYIDSDQPDADCRNLDWYLDRIEEQALYLAAGQVLKLRQKVAREHGAEAAHGLVLAVNAVSPYTRRTDGHLIRKSDELLVPRFPGDGVD
jgi:hypothetical protein